MVRVSRLARRDWLKMFGLAIGSLSFGRLRSAESGSSSTPHAANEVVKLSLNENPFGPAPGASEAIRGELSRLCRYTGTEYDDLVATIAAKENVPREQVILGEILEPLGTHLSLQGGAGGEFIYSDPGYTALVDAAAAVGGRGIAVPLNARLENDLPAITARLSERTRAVYLVNPHNPTGIVADADEWRQAVRAIARRTLVIVDEAYLEFADRFAQRTLSDLVRGGENVIVFRTLAKIYGMAGLDIGYGLLPKSIADVLSAQGLTNPHLFNRLAVAAAGASLNDSSYVAAVAERVAEEREQWFRLFRELKLRFTASRANFVFFETGVPHAEFAAKMLAAGIAIGHVFPPYERWARISIGLPLENAPARQAVRRLLGKGAS